jgi:hypothetical protein
MNSAVAALLSATESLRLVQWGAVAAHEIGLIDRIAPLLVRLRDDLRFFLSDEVITRALEQTGEADSPD